MSFKINDLVLATRLHHPLAEVASSMLSNDQNKPDQPNITQKVSGGGHTGIIAGLAAGLVLALAGDAYLINRSNDLNDQVAQAKQDAKTEIAKLSESTNALLEQDRQQLQALSEDVSGKYETANLALQK